MKTNTRLRSKAKEIALECYVNPREDFLDKVEEELEKLITPEFVERIRNELVKKSKPLRPENNDLFVEAPPLKKKTEI